MLCNDTHATETHKTWILSDDWGNTKAAFIHLTYADVSFRPFTVIKHACHTLLLRQWWNKYLTPILCKDRLKWWMNPHTLTQVMKQKQGFLRPSSPFSLPVLKETGCLHFLYERQAHTDVDFLKLLLCLFCSQVTSVMTCTWPWSEAISREEGRAFRRTSKWPSTCFMPMERSSR